MKRLLLMVLLLMIAHPAFSALSIYGSAGGGITLADDSSWTDRQRQGDFTFKPGGVFFLALGLNTQWLRPEIELSYQNNNIDQYTVTGFGTQPLKADVSVISSMLNVYLDFLPNTLLTPFVMAGAGVSGVQAEFDNEWGRGMRSDGVFAWQVGAGLSWRISENARLDLHYRHFETGETTLNKPEEIVSILNGTSLEGPAFKYVSQNILMNLRFVF